jgi:hypothetical protein
MHIFCISEDLLHSMTIAVVKAGRIFIRHVMRCDFERRSRIHVLCMHMTINWITDDCGQYVGHSPVAVGYRQEISEQIDSRAGESKW